MKDNEIYGMSLHGEINFGDFSVMRVPGGWLYRFKNYIGKEVYRYDTCFVPYNDEFKDRE